MLHKQIQVLNFKAFIKFLSGFSLKFYKKIKLRRLLEKGFFIKPNIIFACITMGSFWSFFLSFSHTEEKKEEKKEEKVDAERYFKIVKSEQVKVINSYTVQLDEALIYVKSYSELASIFGYSSKYKVIHFGLIVKNNWYITENGASDTNASMFPILFAHVLPTKTTGIRDDEIKTAKYTHLRVHFYSDLSQIEKELLRVIGGGQIYQSKFETSTATMKQCIPLLNDVLGKQYTFKPWELGLSPNEFKESDDMNCKRFVNKVEKHIHYTVPNDVWEKAVEIITDAAQQDAQLANYVNQIEGRDKMTARQLSDHACFIL
ncbi:hypothetical protein RFI_37920 [Reticulomyxa filosa]|uniref:Uncharacterized protein n=1 Tax=Reticulomyxa filosa TaxID=46433 RepID=X6LEJ7_RETFI|nr:hypothetical protein RFI_37920 [Reticulomyxa filosa]|eukprot:ETN99551.1 hypothetical protein RFI_37920 [Reticulomyxa filosa]